MGYEFTDTDESFTLTLRNSVLEVMPTLADDPAAVVQLTREFGNRMLRGQESLQSGEEFWTRSGANLIGIWSNNSHEVI